MFATLNSIWSSYSTNNFGLAHVDGKFNNNANNCGNSIDDVPMDSDTLSEICKFLTIFDLFGSFILVSKQCNMIIFKSKNA